MANIFAGSEIVQLGVQIEKNGKDFYNTLAAKIKDTQASGIFKYLAGEEEKHIVMFQKLLNSIESYVPAESYPGEYFAYMSALSGEYVFTQENKGIEVAKAIKSNKEAVDMGIGFEKDSIVFYVGMKKVVPEYNKRIVDELIAQEETHLKQLTDLKKRLI